MSDARAAEYQVVIDQAAAASGGDARARARAGVRLHAELRRIERRDFFPPPQRETARVAVRALPTGSAAAVEEARS
jgi:hypothetical protein